jgi:hypothetical protein
LAVRRLLSRRAGSIYRAAREIAQGLITHCFCGNAKGAGTFSTQSLWLHTLRR